ncbi:hypothetical protein CASFOL_027970 [Castilleja foliolosa]|uniref:Disease resistance N-terminal domain-containing protein n=1 Tax=Castilleja foliolosa TaxID=1961234 RepID=A0ABD3CI55_9LAMI
MKQQLLFALKLVTITGAYLFTRSRTPANKLRSPEKAIAVLFVLENLKRFFVHNANLIRGAKTQIEILENEIRLLKAFLRDCANVADRGEDLEQLMEHIQSVVREGDDLIANFNNREMEIRDSNLVQRALFGPVKLIGVAKEVSAVRAKVKIIYEESRIFSANRMIRSAASDGATAEVNANVF